jgi:hypothetical protein
MSRINEPAPVESVNGRIGAVDVAESILTPDPNNPYVESAGTVVPELSDSGLSRVFVRNAQNSSGDVELTQINGYGIEANYWTNDGSRVSGDSKVPVGRFNGGPGAGGWFNIKLMDTVYVGKLPIGTNHNGVGGEYPTAPAAVYQDDGSDFASLDDIILNVPTDAEAFVYEVDYK